MAKLGLELKQPGSRAHLPVPSPVLPPEGFWLRHLEGHSPSVRQRMLEGSGFGERERVLGSGSVGDGLPRKDTQGHTVHSAKRRGLPGSPIV